MACATFNNIINSRRSYEYLRRIQGILLYKMVGTVIHLTYKCASCAFVQKYLFKREYSDKIYCRYQHVLCKMWCICMSTNFLIKLFAMLNKGFIFYKTHTYTPHYDDYGQNESLYTSDNFKFVSPCIIIPFK
jgi:hypothetical protein